MAKGIFLRTEEHCRNISLALKGKKKSPEHVQKMREIFKGVGIGRKHTEKAKLKMRLNIPRGARHHSWKGDSANYVTKHQWIYRNFGKADRCELNPSHTERYFEWHNLSGQYLRDRSDWIMVCGSCHRKIGRAKNAK